VHLLLVAAGRVDHQRPHPAALGDDVVLRERLAQVEPLVDLLEQEVAVGVVDLGERHVDARVGGADDRPHAHRDHVEQAARVVEEREHALVVVGGEPRHHQVDALRVDDAVIGGHAPRVVELVDERAGRVDDHLAPSW
jgi:hypothetical protein